MKVSSETLFHFTNNLQNIESILSKKFRLTYCAETWSLNNKVDTAYFAMVCFCDLPLSMIKDHINKYGNYAIGMKKNWGIKKRLNPVIYIENNSIIAKDLDNSLSHIDVLLGKINKELDGTHKANKRYISRIYDDINNATDLNLNIFRYIKNYEGTLHRNNKIIKNYRFYDEREWRYVPEFTDQTIEIHLSKRKYDTYRKKNKNKTFIKGIVLDFTAEDIEYLIVKTSKDIPRLIQTIQSTNNLAKNGDELLELTTRIMTVEQLHKDF